ncbi:hypothetical protein GCM10017161_19760 [Thalassotalea marina]|uniref:Rhamnogalacturonan lyase domain-containing protein n=1 Tax=Thalassotalea marina TaxID=1673741 RepID=A0A919BIM7_9GAMM|nr:hypothetical protein GCM10017161_19760 [Thalassotalea marina]
MVVQVFDQTNKPIKDIVAFAIPKFAIDSLPSNTSQVVIDQKDKKFAPYMTVIQKGQKLTFENKDDITHHIYSVSGENRFEFKLKTGETKQTQALIGVEEIAMGCNVHDWMSGFTLVVDTPYFGKTDDKGNLSFNNLKPGNYEISVWHPQLDAEQHIQSQYFEITQGLNTLDFVLKKALLPIPTQQGQDEFDFLEEY